MAYDFKKLKDLLKCNYPKKSPKEGRKKVVKACKDGKEKIIHYGATGYDHNYSTEAKKSFRARHKCDTSKDKLSADGYQVRFHWTLEAEL